MNFDFSDDQHAIKRTANEMLAQRFKLEKVRELAEAGEYHDEAWKEMCELGWAGIFIDEEHGGQGLGLVELVILCEELGYALAPVPFLGNAAAGLAIQAAGSDEQKQQWLPGIASGEARGALGIMRGDSAQLVPDAVGADVIVLYNSGSVQLVPAADADIEPLDVIDSTRSYARVSTDGGDTMDNGGDAHCRFSAAAAAELTGISQRAMEMAVAYARDRKQFDRPVGAYQGVSHRCAQMLLETEGARSATYYAGWCGDSEPASLPVASSMAKAYASDAGWRVTASALQVLGGIGFTWEHDLHFFLKRAKVDGVLFGTASEHRDWVAEGAGLAREAAPA